MSRFPATGHPWPGRPARGPIAAARAFHACFLATLAFVLGSVSAAEVSFQISDQKNAPVADAVVSLVRLDEANIAAAPGSGSAPEPVQIVQEGLEFRPYVTAIRVGTPVVFPNHDTVQHHVYSVSKPKNFELPLYMPGKAETVVFDQPGPIVIGCNIHDWMSAHVLVLETPWFVRTDTSGAATLAVPAGRYRAEVWHPRLPKMATQEITLGDAPAAPLTFALALRPDRRIRRAPTTKGGGYR